jgi:hypothetical protein
MPVRDVWWAECLALSVSSNRIRRSTVALWTILQMDLGEFTF